MECCQFLTPSLCFQKFRIASKFELFFTIRSVDGTIQESGEQFGGRCLENKETVAAQRLNDPTQSEQIAVSCSDGVGLFFACSPCVSGVTGFFDSECHVSLIKSKQFKIKEQNA